MTKKIEEVALTVEDLVKATPTIGCDRYTKTYKTVEDLIKAGLSPRIKAIENSYYFTSEYLATTLAEKLTRDELLAAVVYEAEQESIWTYTAVEVPARNAWIVDVYDEDGERLGAL